MTNINIGDQVRLLKGTEEGIVSKIVNDKIIEIEIEDGFHIPVLKNEVVIISKEEESVFGLKEKNIETQPSKIEKKAVDNSKGIFLAFKEINNNRLSMIFVNNTDYDLLFTISGILKEAFEGYNHGLVEKKSFKKITELSKENFDKWPSFIVQILFYKSGIFKLKDPLTKTIKLKAASLFKTMRNSPILNVKAYLYQIDSNIQPIPIDVKKITETLYEKSEFTKNEYDKALNTYADVVDLHIEKLVTTFDHLSKKEILDIQLGVFEKTINRAISSGMDNIIFIHGVGNGTLMSLIHKRLLEIDKVKFQKYYNSEKFGMGATLVRIH